MVEVQAESLFEAVVSAVTTFKAHDCELGDVSKIEVEIRNSVTHELLAQSAAVVKRKREEPERRSHKGSGCVRC